MDIQPLFKHLSLDQIEEAIEQLKDLYREKFKETYHVILFCNSNGIHIRSEIEKETGFEVKWTGPDGCQGVTNVIVPIEKYSKELEEDIRKKYDSYYKEWVKEGRTENH